MDSTTATLSFKDEIILDFNSNKDLLFASNESYIKQIRQKAIGAFERLGIPNKKHEEYKYVNMEALLKKEFSTHAINANNIISKEAESFKIVPGAATVFIVNGMFHK